MPTNIKVFQNDSGRSVIAFNAENVGNSFLITPGATATTNPGLWISWHADKPLVLATAKGVCRVWDANWQIHGAWEGNTNEVIFLNGQANGVGGDVQVNVADDGDITMKAV